MDIRVIQLAGIVVVLLFGIILNIFKTFQQNKKYNAILKIHNKEIFFINGNNLDIKNDCYPPDDFFKLHNSGRYICDKLDLSQYIRCATKSDYYL